MEIFSYHLVDARPLKVFTRLVSSRALSRVDGLLHSECLLTMKMGRSVMSPTRYNFGTLSFFARWRDEACLEAFLGASPYPIFARPHWHLRLRFYRRWGSFSGLDDAPLSSEIVGPSGPVVGITLARLRLTQTFRFAKWGKPVEEQVRDHPEQITAAVAFRPFNTFSTFSVWSSEAAMVGMVRGTDAARDGLQHKTAMVERARKPFHFEFTTMRFVPLSEHGARLGRGPVLVTQAPEGAPPAT